VRLRLIVARVAALSGPRAGLRARRITSNSMRCWSAVTAAREEDGTLQVPWT